MFTKSKHRGGDCLKKGVWTDHRFKGGASQKRVGWWLWGGRFISQCTLCFMLTYTFLTIFAFFINKNEFFSFSFLFCDEISNNRNRILTNQKPEQVIRNCLWSCMCNSSVINIRLVGLPFCHLTKVDIGQPSQI